MNTEITKNKIWKVGLLTLSALGLFLVALFVGQLKTIFDIGTDHPITNTITVSGKGEIPTIPDIATFDFSVTETAKTVADAQTAATTKINAALKAVGDAGVDTKKDVKTLSYNINPHYDYQAEVCTTSYPGTCRPGKNILTGYDVSQTLQVKVRDISKAGALFTSVGSLDVQNVDSLQFSIDKIDSVKDDARTLAIEDAKIHAEKLASALGVHLIRVVNFSDDNAGSPTPYPVMYAMDSAASGKVASAPQIPAGEQKVSANVSVTYEIR
jgi:uncharacterized protein YggE